MADVRVGLVSLRVDQLLEVETDGGIREGLMVIKDVLKKIMDHFLDPRVCIRMMSDEQDMHQLILEVREVVGRVEDVIDSHFHSQITKESRHFFIDALKEGGNLSLAYFFSNPDKSVRRQINKLGSQVIELSNRLSCLLQDASSSSISIPAKYETQQRQRQRHKEAPPPLLGREKEVAMLKQLLLQKPLEGGPEVISICGMGGIGKTSVPKRVFKSSSSISIPAKYETQQRQRHKEAPPPLVGREKEVAMLKQLLLQEPVEGGPEVISICGMGGIGKTTLAKHVFKSVNRHFDCFAWVFASARRSTECILRDVFTGFIKSQSGVVEPSELNKMEAHALTHSIRKFLGGNKFLLVLDDMDATNSWYDVSLALPTTECKGGKVILTTRREDVANAPASILLWSLYLPSLAEDHALELLHGRACPSQHHLPRESLALATKIVKLCQGVPLAIATVGGLLSATTSETPVAWHNVLHLLEEANDFGSGLMVWNNQEANKMVSNNQEANKMVWNNLTVCFLTLPWVLKCCFLYCGMFPPHYEFRCKWLIRLWAAEGFTMGRPPEKTFEEFAEELLEELIGRNLVEVAGVGEAGEIESCCLPSLMSEFALKMAREYHFCTVLNGSQRMPPVAHRLAMHDFINDSAPKVITEETRSFLVFWDYGCKIPPFPSNSLSKSKLLRVLNLQHTRIDSLPVVVGDLVLLCYLGLRGTGLHELPSSLKSLCNLQTLDIRDTHIKVLPGLHHGLKAMRHLFLSNSFGSRLVELEEDVMDFTDLQTLAGMKLTKRTALALKQLAELVKLSVGEVQGVEMSQLLIESISCMKRLNSLTIESTPGKDSYIRILNPPPHLEKLRLAGWVGEPLSWVSKIFTLKYLYMWNCMLTRDPISTLHHLPNLVVLSLSNSYQGKQMCCDDADGFRKLKKLSILHSKNLENWKKIKRGAMRELEIIVVGWCPKLRLPPKGLEYLNELKMLEMAYMSAEFVAAARDIPRQSGLDFCVVNRFSAQRTTLY